MYFFLVKVFKNVKHLIAGTTFETAGSAWQPQDIMLLKYKRMQLRGLQDEWVQGFHVPEEEWEATQGRSLPVWAAYLL